MKHLLTKKSHERHLLDGKEFETRSFLPHDLMHFAYANITKSREGFFTKGENLMREEMIVGALQGALKEYVLREEFDFEDFILRLNDYLVLNQHTPVNLSAEVIEKIFAEYQYFFRRWQTMRTGESIAIQIS